MQQNTGSSLSHVWFLSTTPRFFFLKQTKGLWGDKDKTKKTTPDDIISKSELCSTIDLVCLETRDAPESD